jgi:hypothetical protein
MFREAAGVDQGRKSNVLAFCIEFFQAVENTCLSAIAFCNTKANCNANRPAIKVLRIIMGLAQIVGRERPKVCASCFVASARTHAAIRECNPVRSSARPLKCLERECEIAFTFSTQLGREMAG